MSPSSLVETASSELVSGESPRDGMEDEIFERRVCGDEEAEVWKTIIINLWLYEEYLINFIAIISFNFP